MGRRPISFGHISPRCTSQEGRNLILALYTERGAPHLRARCARCDHTFDGELQPGLGVCMEHRVPQHRESYIGDGLNQHRASTKLNRASTDQILISSVLARCWPLYKILGAVARGAPAPAPPDGRNRDYSDYGAFTYITAESSEPAPRQHRRAREKEGFRPPSWILTWKMRNSATLP